MCGIAGVLNLDSPKPIPGERLKRMLETVSYRGPDEFGFYLDDTVGLGHARLKIIDLETGSQPIHNEEKTVWIIFDGEIFNYKELRDTLLSQGHRFYTTTDTEVVLHLYEQKGPDCVHLLNGQFAFAVWNTQDRSLFLARDRVGIRPLHYTIHNHTLDFASEIKSLFTIKDIPREVDPISLDQVFTFGTPLPGRTLFKNVHSLPPPDIR